MTDTPADILIVDDLPANLQALEMALAGLGREIVRAGSCQEALKILLRREFAVMLLDVRMPDMDGLETARYIRMGARSPQTPIIFVTAGADSVEQVAQGYVAGAVDYIIKPLHTDILRSKVKVFLDLYSKSKELEEKAGAMARANQELRRACQELETVSYTVAHDLRAPLRSMNGFGQLLREEYSGKPLDSAGLDYVQRIETAAQRMDRLIHSLLAYCRVASMKMEVARVDLPAIAREAIRQTASEFRGTPEVSVLDPMPAVVANQNALSIVLSNLISNALKFVAPGTGPVVRIRSESNGGWVRIWIEDNGVGIEPAHHDRIFRTFESLDPQGPAGMGMGLAIVRTAIERMGGRVGVESAPGRGSRFWLELRSWADSAPAAPEDGRKQVEFA